MDSFLDDRPALVIVSWISSIGKIIKISQSSIIYMELECGVASYSEAMTGKFHLGLDNLRVDNLVMLRSSRLSITIAGLSLRLE